MGVENHKNSTSDVQYEICTKVFNSLNIERNNPTFRKKTNRIYKLDDICIAEFQ